MLNVKVFLEIADELIERYPFLYVEIARTRRTDYMAWMRVKPGNDGELMASAQGSTADEACKNAIKEIHAFLEEAAIEEEKKNAPKDLGVGDRIYIDGWSMASAYADYEFITRVSTKYDEESGDAYQLLSVGCSDYRGDTGECVKGAKMYYYDLDRPVKRCEGDAY